MKKRRNRLVCVFQVKNGYRLLRLGDFVVVNRSTSTGTEMHVLLMVKRTCVYKEIDPRAHSSSDRGPRGWGSPRCGP